MKKHIPLLMILIVMLSACTTRTSSLTGTWKLTAFGPTDSMKDAVPDAEATLTFSRDGMLSGSSGCNSLGGEYTVEGDQITFGPMTSTLMACDDARNAQESAVFQVLSETAQFEINDQMLTIVQNGMSLVFTSVPASE